MPKFNLQFYQAWKQKGIFDEVKQWSAYKPNGTAVITVWHTDIAGGPSEVQGEQLSCIPGDWIKKPKGKAYLAMARECWQSGQPAEVLLLAGFRSDEEHSEVFAVSIDETLYQVTFTDVREDGTILGTFHARTA